MVRRRCTLCTPTSRQRPSIQTRRSSPQSRLGCPTWRRSRPSLQQPQPWRTRPRSRNFRVATSHSCPARRLLASRTSHRPARSTDTRAAQTWPRSRPGCHQPRLQRRRPCTPQHPVERTARCRPLEARRCLGTTPCSTSRQTGLCSSSRRRRCQCPAGCRKAETAEAAAAAAARAAAPVAEEATGAVQEVDATEGICKAALL